MRIERTAGVLASVLMGVTGLAGAQDLTPKAGPQTRAIVVDGAMVHPVWKSGQDGGAGEAAPPIADGVVYFKDGTIQGVYTRSAWSEFMRIALWDAPPRVIDAKGKHVYPGLIAPMTQLGLTEIQSLEETQDLGEVGGVTPEVRAGVAINPDSTLLPVTRRNGILLAGVFPGGGLIPGQASVVRMDAWTTEDANVTTDRGNAGISSGMVLRWPNVRPIVAWWNDRSEEDQMKDIKRDLEEIARVFDTAKNYVIARGADPSLPVDVRWEAMAPVFKEGVKPEGAKQLQLYVQAQDADQISSAVQFCADRGLRCIIVGGRDAHLVSEMLKKHDVPVIVQGVQNMPRRDDAPVNEPFMLPAKLAAAGVRFAIASNDDTAHERNLPYAVATAVAHGLEKAAGLRSITIDAAKILGVDAKYGSLEKGKSATLIITTGDPMEVTSDVVMSFLDGREIDMSNKQTKLAEKYLERYRQEGELKGEQK
jgi:imidazolonepropionase-like amidohydrolase